MSMRSDEHARGTPPGLTQSYIWLVPAVYALFGVIWILFTDKLVASLATNEAQLVTMQLWKGWLYVLLTTLLLLVLLRIGAAWEQAYIRSLRTSERKYRQLVETMQEGFGIQDAEMNITYVNEAFCRMMGCSASELVSRSVLDFLDEANRQVMREETEKRKRGILGAYELEWIAHDGRSVATLVSPAPMHGDDGELVGTFATLADITERIRSEQALRESEEKFRTLAEQALLGLNIFREEEVLYVNDAFCQIYGAVKDEIAGQPLTSLVDTVHPDDRPWVHDLGRRRLAGEPGVPGEYEYRIVTPAGEVKWLHAFVKSITLEGKRATMHTVVDITAQKAAEEAFHAEKERAQMYLNLAPVMFVAVDRTGRITLVNDKACEVLDRDRKDIAGKRWFENFVPPQARERVQSVFDKLMAGRVEAASVFVNPVLTSSGEEKMIEWRNTVFRDEAGRPAGTLSAGVDITERREMEWALRESESRFRSLFGTMTEGVAIHEAVRNETGDITDFFIKDVNPAFEQLIGLKRQQLVGAKASEVYGAELRSHFRECATVAERGRPARFEARTKAPERYFDVKCFAPRKGWFAAVIDDVTEVRLAQIALWHEKDLVSRIMETSPAGITLVNKQGQITYANPAAEKVLGLSASKIVERAYNDPEWRITDYEGRPFFDNHLPFARVMATGQPVSGVKHAIEWPNGRRTLLVINASPLRSVSGDMEGMVAVVEDVTNAVKVQQELKESEERMQSILRASPVGIGLTKNRVFQWTNEFLSRMLGYTAAELEGQSARMVYESDEEFVHVGEVKYAQIEAWGIGNIETRLRCKDGSVIDVLLSSTYLNPGSPEGGVIFTAMDVTDRKAVERALGESERAMSTLLSNLPGVVYRCRNDRDWTMEFISDGITALTGYEPADVIENQRLSYNDLIHPDDRERVWKEVSRAFEGNEPFTLEYRVVTRDGMVKHVWEQGCAIRNQEGEDETLEGYIVDVTERKQAEQKLRESEERYRHIFTSSPLGIGISDLDGNVLDCNRAMEDITGYNLKEFKQISLTGTYVNAEDRAAILKALRKDGAVTDYSAKLKRKDGTPYDALLNIALMRIEDKEVVHTVCQDTTERKAAEQALRESEEKFRLLAENSRDLIYRYRLKPQRSFEYVSPAATALTGYTPEEHYADPELGIKIVDPKDRHVLQMYFEQGGIFDQPIVLRWKRKDGSMLWAEQLNWPIRDENGEIVAIEGISRDITERKTAEDALIESRHLLRELTQSVMNAQEEERARISREIHDELAQMLTALRIDLSSIVRRVPQEMDDLLKRTKVMDEHISTTVDVVRRISAELRPSVLDNLGLAAAVEWQVNEFKKRTGADARLRVQPKELELDEGRSVAVFRILQEALTNVARHADATRADVSLTLGRGKLRLRVRDNGKGMAAGKPDPTKALGIAGMRERARLWGGSVRIESAVNEGTAVVLEMPYPAKIPDRGDDVEDTHRGRPRSRPAGAKADTRRKTRGRQDR